MKLPIKYSISTGLKNSPTRLVVAALFFAAVTIFVSSLMPSSNNHASALSGSDFNAGHLIDDAVFYNQSSMDPGVIQDFLNSKVPACDTSGSQPAADFGRPDITRAQYAALQGWQAPPYVCLRDYQQNTPQVGAASGLCEGLSAQTNRTGAQIIYDVAQACHINPQVLIVLLQKEQNLVLDTWPLNSQYTSATGFACADTSPCDPAYGGFFYQVYYAARQFQIYKAHPLDYNYIAGRTNTIYYNPGPYNNSAHQYYGAYGTRPDINYCGSSQVYIENQATAALYIYTPYQPDNAALTNLYGLGDTCSSYGNRNFWRVFSDWFGTTLAFVHNGVNYSDVFDPVYYLNKYPDLQAAYGTNAQYAFSHFIQYGMSEGRQASAAFDVVSYRNRYPDLRFAFGTNLTSYYLHYISNGKAEGRVAIGDIALQPVTSYKGVDYSSVYNYSSYLANYADMQQKYSNDDTGALLHFISEGILEGRQASSEFNVNSYRSTYYDLRRVFGTSLRLYYLHYITNGKAEGRTGTGSYLGGISTANGFNYSSVYSFNSYATGNSDIWNTYGLDDNAALLHFINFGMNEGRLASPEFNVYIYKNRYPDLQAAFGSNLKAYYLHYITNGKAEGRTAN